MSDGYGRGLPWQGAGMAQDERIAALDAEVTALRAALDEACGLLNAAAPTAWTGQMLEAWWVARNAFMDKWEGGQ